MPGLETSNLNQKAVLFPFTAYDRAGQPTVGEPQEIPVRWLTVRKQAVDAKGNTVLLSAQAIVGVSVYPESQMWLGTLADWLATSSNPSTVDEELCEVVTYNGTPDIKSRDYYQTLGLMRLRDKNVNQ